MLNSPLNRMVTVSHLVENIIGKKPYLQQALVRGIVNYAALAELMQPEIQTELKKEVKASAIMMALRRLHDKLESKTDREMPLLAPAEVSIKSNLFALTVLKSPSVFEKIEKFYKAVDFNKGDTLSISQGNFEVTLISNIKYLQDIKKMLGGEHIVEEVSDLSALSIVLPKEAHETPGVIYNFLKELSWENINVIEVVSTHSEFVIIIKDRDSAEAYKCIKRLG